MQFYVFFLGDLTSRITLNDGAIPRRFLLMYNV